MKALRLVQRLAEEEHRIRFLVSRILWHTRMASLVKPTIGLRDGSVLHFHPSSMAANLWHDNSVYENHVAFHRRFLRASDTFIDVGANIGLHTIVAASIVGPTGRVISIEPHPRTAAWMRSNLQLNGMEWVDFHQVALGRESTRAGLTSLRQDDQNYLRQEGHDVAVRPLDEIVPADLDVDLIKLDVEGYEPAVLAGATATLRRTVVVFFEVRDGFPQRHGFQPQDTFDLLEAAGFRIFRMTKDDTLTPIRAPEPGMDENLVAISDLEPVRKRTGMSVDVADI